MYYLEFTYKLHSQIENTNVITLIYLLIGLQLERIIVEATKSAIERL